MIVPFPAGGATDTLGRFIAERLHGYFGYELGVTILQKLLVPAQVTANTGKDCCSA
jgi:hypothetical protein